MDSSVHIKQWLLLMDNYVDLWKYFNQMWDERGEALKLCKLHLVSANNMRANWNTACQDIDDLEKKIDWMKAGLQPWKNQSDTYLKEIERLKAAIIKHKDEFPDEAMRGEWELWLTAVSLDDEEKFRKLAELYPPPQEWYDN